MKDKANKTNQISRRKILPILGSGLLIPFLGFGNINTKNLSDSANEEYQILLRKDGTTVRVKTSELNALKSEKKNISNNALNNWLKNKF